MPEVWDAPPSGDPQTAAVAERFERAFENTLGITFVPGNRVEVLRNGDEIFPSMLRAIDKAAESIEFLTYVYWQGEVADRFAAALIAKAEQGVRVRVLLDFMGAYRMQRQLVNALKRSLVEVQWFRPAHRRFFWHWDSRTHRKVLICDGQVGFTGGVGIAEEWQGDARNANERRDTHFRIHGPAVMALRSAFTSNWAETPGTIKDLLLPCKPPVLQGSARILIARSVAAAGWSDVATTLLTLVHNAKCRLRICTPYFVPTARLTRALLDAKHRGVRIELIIPGHYHDSWLSQRATEHELWRFLEVGIDIYWFQPTLMHAKVALVDEHVACVGSLNLNRRSMGKDDEIAMVILDDATCSTLNTQFDEDLQHCVKVDYERWRRRSWWQRFCEKLSWRIREQL